MRSLESKAIVVVVAISLLIYYATNLTPLEWPDTSSYLHFASIRTAGYPVFCWSLIYLFGTNKAIILCQILLLHMSVLALGLVLQFVVDLTGASLIATILILACPWMVGFAKSLLSEGLYVPLTIVWLAIAVRYVAAPRPWTITWLLAVAALVTITRPAGLVLIPFSLFLALTLRPFQWRSGSLAVPVGVAAVLAIFAGEWTIYNHRYGSPRESLLGIVWLARSALITIPADKHTALATELSPADLKLSDRMDDDFRPVRALIAEVPELALRENLVKDYEEFSMFRYQQIIGIQPPITDIDHMTFNTGTALRIALPRLKAGPWQFLKLVATNYVAIWSPFDIRSPAINQHLRKLIADGKVPFVDEYANFQDVPPPNSLLIVPRIASQSLGFISGIFALLFLGALCFSRAMRLPVYLVGYLSFLLHVYAWFCALTAFGSLRYMTAMFPIVVTLLLFSVVEARNLFYAFPGTARGPRRPA